MKSLNEINNQSFIHLSSFQIKALFSLFIASCITLCSYATSYLETSGFSIWMMPIAFSIIFMLWHTQELISIKLDKKYSWSKYFYKRLSYHAILALLSSFLIINIPYTLYKIYSLKYIEIPGSKYSIYIFLTINSLTVITYLLVTGLYLGLTFIKHWKKTQLENEKLIKESTQARLESLKSQINPHFLFNNLNILSALIEQNKSQSKEFVEKFAEVYRYLLKSNEKEVVDLRTELEFLSAYNYLLKIRFDSGINFKIVIDPKYLDYYLPPLALQLLIENAIKHNITSKNKPLFLDIYVDDDNVVVKNNLQLRNDLISDTKIGLKNISNRYKILSAQDIIIEELENNFIVRLPLLNVESINY